MPAPVEMRLADVNFAPYNPRTITDAQMRALKASIEKHGMVLNLVVQKRGSVLIGGHQRVRAVRELCKERGWPVPERAWATVLDVDDDHAKQLNIALNNIDGDFDPYQLGSMLKSMMGSMTATDVLATGFDQTNIDELIKLTLSPEEMAAILEADVGDVTQFARSITLTVEFATTDERDAAKKLLTEEATRRKVKAGRVILDAMKSAAALKKKPGKPRAA